MKKSFALILSLLLLFAGIGVFQASAASGGTLSHKSDMTVNLNGKGLAFAQSPVIVNNRLLVPYRSIAEGLGATVTYDAATKAVTVIKGANTYVLTINAKTAILNGASVALDVPAMLVNNVTMVPIRFVSENLGVEVGYDNAKRTVSLKTNDAPSFKVFAPTQDSILYTNQVKVSVATFNLQLTDFRTNKTAVNGQGHVHLWLDTDPNDPKVAYKLINGEPVLFDNLATGKHTLTVALEGNDHKLIANTEKQVITFTTASTPTLSVNGPKEGEVITGSKVTVSTLVTGFNLSDFRTKSEVAAGEGHIHIWLDTDVTNPKLAYKQVNGEPVVFDNVKPGDHTLTVQLVGANHKSIAPAVKQVVHFKTQASTAAAASYTIDISDFSFKPDTLTIPVGSKVTFTNKDDVEHTVTAKDGLFDSGLLSKGKTFTMTFTKAGTYHIYCKPHNFMTETIVVK